MKMRNGFVSNSSSSSFILALNSKNMNIIVQVPVADIADVVSSDYDEIVQYLCNDRGYKDEAGLRRDGYGRILDSIKEELEEGKFIALGDISSEDDNALMSFMYDYGIPRTHGINVLEGNER